MPDTQNFIYYLSTAIVVLFPPTMAAQTLRVATFNVSIEATNYVGREEVAKNPQHAELVQELLASGDNSQIRNIAEIIQRVRPEVLLLNEFDYTPEPSKSIKPFIKNYLNASQNAQLAIDYPYHYTAAVNTGVATPFDLDNDGIKSNVAGDAFGFGYYPGQYGMALLSKYPIKHKSVRTFQTFLWKYMPSALQPRSTDQSPWYSKAEWRTFRLSSKSHWDIPIKTKSGVVHIIAAHPTPPTFDGSEDRNGKRNHDEIRFISDYLSSASYIYDDDGDMGGLVEGSRFVIVGDLNSSPDEGASMRGAIQGLLEHPLVDSSCTPTSEAGRLNQPENEFAAQHTAEWGLRVDYVLPSKQGIQIQDCGVFWPINEDPLFELVKSRNASSDHRLVWVDLKIE